MRNLAIAEIRILLPDTDKQQTQVVAEKVRAAVAAIAPSTIDWPVTASLPGCGHPPSRRRRRRHPHPRRRPGALRGQGNGRNRVELFVSPDKPASQRTEAGRAADEQAKISSS